LDVPVVDARAVDRDLRRLVTEKQRQDAILAEHLRAVARRRGYREAGFTSLEEYANDRFGLSPRTLYCLLALHRALEALPALRRAFLAGRVTASQAVLIGSVANVLSMERWIGRAEQVTLRRLQDEVGFVRHLRESRPAIWERLDGGPLPEGVILVPGQAPRLHASAPSTTSPTAAEADAASGAAIGVASPEVPLTAAELLRLLEEAEAATPLPAKPCTIRLWLEREVKELWLAALARLRAGADVDLREWEALALILKEFWRVWDNAETRRQRRDNPTLERDGWRCTAPGCGSVGTGRLHEHHIRFRSAGGTEEASNLTTLCTGHHLGLLHEGRMRCSGLAPDDLIWELGIEPGRGPFQVFRGEARVRVVAESR
jgi:hypothetical protein